MLLSWLKDIYTNHGVIMTLVTIVVLVLLAAGIAWGFGIDLRDIARWVNTLGVIYKLG